MTATYHVGDRAYTRLGAIRKASKRAAAGDDAR